MDITIFPGKLAGSVAVIPSKSQAHRMLICAAFSDAPTHILCAQTNRDMEATAGCLNALGASVTRTAQGYRVVPLQALPQTAQLPCRDSGSTLRFLLPIAGALGVDATFCLEGRLASRPLSPLWEEMQRMGCALTRPTADTIRCRGKLRPGRYTIDGGISSQFITGLLLAFPLIGGECHLEITGKTESKPYIHMTRDVIRQFSGHPYRTPGEITVEGDWSNGAFWLSANALGSKLDIQGLRPDSLQGDKAVSAHLDEITAGKADISAGDIPDLVPILAVAAACNQGAVFTDIQRLRLKESDRVASVLAMLRALGGKADATEDCLTVYGTGLTGGTVDAVNDHRIAMAAAIAATACTAPVTIAGAQCVSKSYPQFFDEYRRLGGKYEQHLR